MFTLFLKDLPEFFLGLHSIILVIEGDVESSFLPLVHEYARVAFLIYAPDPDLFHSVHFFTRYVEKPELFLN